MLSASMLTPILKLDDEIDVEECAAVDLNLWQSFQQTQQDKLVSELPQ